MIQSICFQIIQGLKKLLKIVPYAFVEISQVLVRENFLIH